MATDMLSRLEKEAGKLNDEQLRALARRLLAQLLSRKNTRLKWEDVCGIAGPPDGPDAQEWISARRAAADRVREANK